MTDIDWVEIPFSEVRPGMRIGPLSTWSLDVYGVRPEGLVCLNLDNKQATTYKVHDWSKTVHVLHVNGEPDVDLDGRGAP